MTDFHHNIFYYYRGAKQSEKEREQQLENNTTKALINTLQHCSPEVTREFLKELGITAHGKTEFVLQKSTIGDEKIRSRPKRVLLGIVGTAEAASESICTQLSGIPYGDSLPDAWLYGEDFVVLLESKVGNSSLERNQMLCHWRKLRPEITPFPFCKVLTWTHVHKFFVALLPKLGDKNRWLVEQFIEYLEWTEMTEFIGFEEGMFEFFVQSKKDPDTKEWVRKTMQALGERILSDPYGLRVFNAFYEDYHIGNLGSESDHYWVAFGPKDFRNVAHQTISLYEYGLDVFVNVELLPAVEKLRKRIQDDDSSFRQVVSQLPDPFTIQIQERKLKRPRFYDYYMIAEVKAGIYEGEPYGLKDPQSPGFEYVEKLLRQIKYPYLSVRKRINREQVLELSKRHGEALVSEILDTLKVFHSVVDFINQ